MWNGIPQNDSWNSGIPGMFFFPEIFEPYAGVFTNLEMKALG